METSNPYTIAREAYDRLHPSDRKMCTMHTFAKMNAANYLFAFPKTGISEPVLAAALQTLAICSNGGE